MTQLYRDYVWKEGIPYGFSPSDDQKGYKIVMDPYRKRISLERYAEEAIPELIYDSYWLDFRHLKQPEQVAWQKSLVSETAEQAVCLIRDQNDRLLFIETYQFAEELCRQCLVTSLQGTLLCKHQMFYSLLNDPFDGVILYDAHAHPVLFKRYLFDKESQQFTELLETCWDMQRLEEYLQKGDGPSPKLHAQR